MLRLAMLQCLAMLRCLAIIMCVCVAAYTNCNKYGCYYMDVQIHCGNVEYIYLFNDGLVQE
jgi:hypothetical protein